MSYIVNDKLTEDTNTLIQENIILKKKIKILETANSQLKREVGTYKSAYERLVNFAPLKIIKKLRGR